MPRLPHSLLSTQLGPGARVALLQRGLQRRRENLKVPQPPPFPGLHIPQGPASNLAFAQLWPEGQDGALQFELDPACPLGIFGGAESLPCGLTCVPAPFFAASSMWRSCCKTSGSLSCAPAPPWRSRPCCPPCSRVSSASKSSASLFPLGFLSPHPPTLTSKR